MRGRNRRMPRIYLAALVVTSALLNGVAGCQRQADRSQTKQDLFKSLGELPGLRQTHSPELKAELNRLIAENATPEQLTHHPPGPSANDDSAAPSRAAPATTDREPVASVFGEETVSAAAEQLEQFYPPQRFEFSPKALAEAVALRDELAADLQQYRHRLVHSEFRFTVSAMSGLAADLSFVDEAQLAHRLEAINVADSLAKGYPNEAVLPLRNMFRIDRHLAAVWHVVPRLNAAVLRHEALQALVAISSHSDAGYDLKCQLLQMVSGMLADWPPDENAWIGDRALGMHSYELVRRGDLISLLNAGEFGRLKYQSKLEPFVDQIAKNVDADELFYLQSMRKVIASCQEPYAARQTTMKRINKRLNQLTGTAEYPAFAAQFLLNDMEQGLRLQVLDRARCRACCLALATVTENSPAAFEMNPLTGQPYRLEITANDVVVGDIDGVSDAESIVIPRTAPDPS